MQESSKEKLQVKQLKEYAITDENLIRLFKKTVEKSKVYSEKTRKLIEELEEKSLHVQREKAKNLWENLFKDAMLFLRENDTRQKKFDKDTDDEEVIVRYFEEFISFENILYGSGPFYRDHTIHVIRNFLLGNFCISNTFGFGDIVIPTSPHDKKIFEKVSSDVKEAMWCIISLCHDLGYPLETVKNINKNVIKMITSFGPLDVRDLSFTFPTQSQPISDQLLKLVSSRLTPINVGEDEKKYVMHLQSKFYLKFSKSFEKYDHGIMSCLLLFKKLSYFLETDFTTDERVKFDECDAVNFLIKREIMRAIAGHTCPEIYHLSLNNFSLLLILFDEFQEWDRPVPKNLYTGNERSEVKLKLFNKTSVYFEINFDEAEDGKEFFHKKCKAFRKWLRWGIGERAGSINVRFDFHLMDREEYGIFIHTGDPSNIYSEFKKEEDHNHTKIKELWNDDVIE